MVRCAVGLGAHARLQTRGSGMSKSALICRACGAALGLALTVSGAAAAEPGVIRIGHTTWVGYGPMYLARDLGYFKEAGVDVQLEVIEDAALYMAAAAAGELDGSRLHHRRGDEVPLRGFLLQVGLHARRELWRRRHPGAARRQLDQGPEGQAGGDERGLGLAVLVRLSPEEGGHDAGRRHHLQHDGGRRGRRLHLEIDPGRGDLGAAPEPRAQERRGQGADRQLGLARRHRRRDHRQLRHHRRTGRRTCRRWCRH